jgi:hypothetical protein
MDSNPDETHGALMAASAKYANKVSPLLIACGLIQEGVNLNQALAAHAAQLKKELDGFKKAEIANQNSAAVLDGAQRPPA